MKIHTEIVRFPLQKPFAITGREFRSTETVRVTLAKDGVVGRGEAVGSYYLDETPETMTQQLEIAAEEIDGGLAESRVQTLLPPGGARNALDCALWDYQAKAAGKRVWELLAITPRALRTVFTLGIDSVETMAQQAEAAQVFSHLKIKLNSDRPIERLEIIRAARPDASLIVDVNQGWTFEELKEYAPHCARLGVAMIEQPLPRGKDQELEDFRSPVRLGADESCLHLGEFSEAAQRYQVLNIKLDKCGGLSEGLALVEAAKRSAMQVMVGNMMGSSLSMAPSFIVGLLSDFVDIDGPLLLADDIDHGLTYGKGGLVQPPAAALWG
ncbi:MAG: dipeptide epimerase [Pseudomonadota bacterium]